MSLDTEPMLALPGQDTTSNGGLRRHGTRRLERSLQYKAILLSWLPRLCNLHRACTDPLLQSLALSIWGRCDDGERAPPLAEVMQRFQVSIRAEESVSVMPLLSACSAAHRRCGSPTDLALCMVALCRAMRIPARLVLAFDTSSGKKSTCNEVEVDGTLSETSTHARATPANAASQISIGMAVVVDDDDDDTDGPVGQLVAMGFTKDAALSALLQSEEEGNEGDGLFGRAVALLLEGGDCAPTSSTRSPVRRSSAKGNDCAFCNARMQVGAFCGECGARIRDGGALGASDVEVPLPPPEAAQPEAQVTVWPEAYDVDAGCWIAVDVVSGFLARNPVIEWTHRGVPMLWVTSVDTGVDDSGEGIVLRDVTPRYSPVWWRVEQQRIKESGSRVVQDWWDQTLSNLSASRTSDSSDNIIAIEADLRDQDELRSLRKSDGVPTTRAALKGHRRYILQCDLRTAEVLLPSAKSVSVVGGIKVFLRSDVQCGRSQTQWRKFGRLVGSDEKPAKICQKDQTSLFLESQTTPMPKKPRLAPGSGARTRKRPTDPAAELADLPFPALPAPPKKRTRKPITVSASFAKASERLREWLEDHGHLPWDKSINVQERQLARWVSKIRQARARGQLSPAQRSCVEALPDWEWGSEVSMADDDEADAGTDGPDKLDGEITEAAEDMVSQWLRLTMQRLSSELARQGNASDRRARLRFWQRMYHPDKNPGRAHEVLPLFRWVQGCWERDFRGQESTALATASAGTSASSEVPTESAKPAGSARDESDSNLEHVEAPRRRVKGKSRPTATFQ